MSFILLQAANSLFTSEFKTRASTYLGEPEARIAKALGAVIPSLLGIFTEKCDTVNGLNTLTVLVNDQYSAGAHLHLERYFSTQNGSLLNKGDKVAGELLGNRAGNFIGNISTYAGIKPASAACLLSIAVPALLALAGDKAVSSYDGNIASVFEGQYDSILTAIPEGFNVKNILNEAAAGDEPVSYLYTKEKNAGRKSLRRVLSTLLLLLAVIASWYFFKKRM